MDDYLEILKQYNGLAEISALVEETQKLRGYYLSKQYSKSRLSKYQMLFATKVRYSWGIR